MASAGPRMRFKKLIGGLPGRSCDKALKSAC
jgi:hypothetical protein